MSDEKKPDLEENQSLTGTKDPISELVTRTAGPGLRVSYVDYFLNKDVYNSYPLGDRAKRKILNLLTCRKTTSFVDELAYV